MKATYRSIIPETNPRPFQRLGRIVEHDPLSRGFGVSIPKGITDPSQLPSVEWERFIPPLDQGDLGSCTGNAIVGLLATAPFSQSKSETAGLDEALAVKLYSEATRLDRFPGKYPPDDTGSSGNAVAKAARKHKLIASWNWTFGVLSFVSALQTQPVMVGVPWYEGMFNPDANGIVKATGDIAGGHEFEVSGWDRENELLICWNSWGIDWGKGGKFYIPLATWKELHDQQADVTLPRIKT